MSRFLQSIKQRLEQMRAEINRDQKELFVFYKDLIQRRDKRKVEVIKKNLQI